MRKVDTGEGEIAFAVHDVTPPWRRESQRPIVLQHGLGLTSEAWRPWLGVLLGPRPIVTIELRGHGESAAAWSADDYPLTRFSEDVRAVLDALEYESCHFVGESFGGTLGIQLAADHPDRVASLSVCSTGFRGDLIANVAHWPDLAQSEEGRAAWSAEILAGRFRPPVDEELAAWVEASQMTVGPPVVAGIVRCLLGADLTAEARALRPRLQILMAADSPFVGTEGPRLLHELVPRSEIVFLDDARHGIVLSHWRQCAEAVRAFIDRTARD